MVVMKSIVVVGDGAAGVMIANKLRYKLNSKEARITVVGSNLRNFCRSDGPLVSLRLKRFGDSVMPLNFLLNENIEFIRDEVTQVRPNNRLIYLKGGKKLDYDYLVLAPGMQTSPELMPGYEGEAKHILDLQHTLELGKTMEDFSSGTAVVAINDMPVPNIIGFYEFAFVLSDQLRKLGFASKTKIKFVYPEEGVFPVTELNSFFEEKFREKNIETVSNFKVTSVNQKNREIVSQNGSMNYDVLVLPPPMRTRDFLKSEELLGGEDGSKNVNKNTLKIRDYDDVYLIGDAVDNLISGLSGSFITQSRYVSGRICDDIGSQASSTFYEGNVTLTAMTGLNKGMTLSYSYSKKAELPKESQADFRFKRYYSDFYFSTLLRGLV